MTSEHEINPDSPDSFQSETARQMRLQVKLVSDFKAQGILTENDESWLDEVKQNLVTIAELVIRMKSNAGNGIPDILPDFGVEHDGITLFVTTPQANPNEKPQVIPVPVSAINPDFEQWLPPISEDLAVKGIRNAEIEKRISNYALRHEDNENLWPRYQKATKDVNDRLIAIVKAASLGQLVNINVYVHEDAGKISIYMPNENSNDGFHTIVSEISTLEEIEPKLTFFLAKII